MRGEFNRRFFVIFAAPLTLGLLFTFSAAWGADKSIAKNDYLVYVGTYTGPQSQGIYAYRFDASTGKLVSLGPAAKTVNPSFLAVDPSRRYLYAVNEIENYQGKKSGGVSAFAMDRETGRLTFLNEVASRGTDPCFVSLDQTGHYVMVANYTSGSVAVFPVLKDGRLGEATAFDQRQGSSVNPERQEGPHAHSIGVTPDNSFVLSADLGLDELLVYRFDAAHGTLKPNYPPFAQIHPGAGPRHFAISPNGKFVYVIAEMGSLMTAFSYNAAHGTLRELQQISTLPKDFKGENNDAEVVVHPSGRFLYGSNRGHDSIAVFAIDQQKGTLTPIQDVSTGGKEPRNFAIDPTGKYLFAANQNSNTIVIFRIDPKTGRLTPTGEKVDVASPVCVTFAAK
ncbi:MAG TPA: lactonase family protein [Terriglobia bacterium]|nr:lactonase family protein [Terriglobia bacterium]